MDENIELASIREIRNCNPIHIDERQTQVKAISL